MVINTSNVFRAKSKSEDLHRRSSNNQHCLWTQYNGNTLWVTGHGPTSTAVQA